MSFTALCDRLWIRRTIMAAALLIGATASIALVLQIRPSYTSQASVLMVAEPVPPGFHQPPETAAKPILSSDLPLLATTPIVLTRVAGDLGLPASSSGLEKLAHRIKAHVSATSSSTQSSAGVLLVSFTATTPAESTAGADAVAREVTRFYRESAMRRFDDLVADLRGQLSRRRAELDRLDARIERETARDPLLDAKNGSGAVSADYRRLVQERESLAASSAADAMAFGAAQTRLAQLAPVIRRETLESDALYRSLRDRYAKDASELSRERSAYSSTYPGLPELEHVVANERAARDRRATQLSAESAASSTFVTAQADLQHARAMTDADAAKLRVVDAHIAAMQTELAHGGDRAALLARLEREREVATSAYQVLAGRLASAMADEAEAGSVGSVNVLDRASFPKQAAYTTRLAVTAMAILFTLAFVAGAMMLVESVDRRLYDRISVEKLYDVPVIATYP